jgi:hypothetical protein
LRQADQTRHGNQVGHLTYLAPGSQMGISGQHIEQLSTGG